MKRNKSWLLNSHTVSLGHHNRPVCPLSWFDLIGHTCAADNHLAFSGEQESHMIVSVQRLDPLKENHTRKVCDNWDSSSYWVVVAQQGHPLEAGSRFDPTFLQYTLNWNVLVMFRPLKIIQSNTTALPSVLHKYLLCYQLQYKCMHLLTWKHR